MDPAVVPAVLAYKGGELFANIMKIVDEIPPGRSLSTDSLELVLRRYAPLGIIHYHSANNMSRTERMSYTKIKLHRISIVFIGISILRSILFCSPRIPGSVR